MTVSMFYQHRIMVWINIIIIIVDNKHQVKVTPNESRK